MLIEKKIGGSASTMHLSIVDGPTQIAALDLDNEKLSNFQLRQNIGIHVEDDPIIFFDQKMKYITINSRCIVSVKDTEYLGIVKYKGKYHRKNGFYIGVELDEPKGNNNGK